MIKKDFREGVLNLGQMAVDGLTEYFEGKRQGTDKVKEFSSTLREAVKVSNRDQMNDQVKRSQAIKLISYIPKEKRDRYIIATNPETAPFLLDSPGKRKK